ncbi:MAG: efflux RND transporter permease subunit [Cyanobacteria bacterium J06639_1]
MARASSSSGLSVSAIAIRQHVGTLMLTLTAIVLGVFFLARLPVDLLPSITYPRIGVRVDTPGISPEVAIDEITRPLEQALTATEGVEQIFSQTREGRISVDLYFQAGGDIDRALNDATASLNRARSRLPDTIDAPRLFKFDPSQLPVYEFALTSPSLAGVDLRTFAEDELVRELTVVPGVASADVSGGVREEVQVDLDLQRMQASGVGVTEVLNALEARNQDISGGRLEGGQGEPLTRTVGKIQRAEEIEALSFEVNGGGAIAAPTRVELQDFATVTDGSENQRIFVTLNGEPAVKLSVQKQPDANTVAVVEAVKRKIDEMRASGIFPDDVTLTATLDESRFIRNSIRNVAISGLTGSGLAAIAVFLFLGSLRQTLIIVIAIPLATLTAIVLMGLFGLSVNVFSLGGLALGVGIVVDNSIVMLEAISQAFERDRLTVPTPAVELEDSDLDDDEVHLGNGSNGNGKASNGAIARDPLAIAERSSRELESALVASTTTNLVAVVPFVLVGGFFALLFNELILTISFSVAASLIVALTVVPMLTSRLLAVKRSSGVGNWFVLRQFRFGLAAMTRRYQRLLAWVLRYRLWVVAAIVIVMTGSSVAMLDEIPQEILPRINTGQADLWASFPPGTTLANNRKAMTAIDRLLTDEPETEYVFTTSGGGIFASTTIENTLRGSSLITFRPGTNVAAFTDRLSRELQQFNLVNTRLFLSPDSVRGLILSNSPVRADIDLILQGSDTPTLQLAGRQVLAALDDRATLARYRPDADRPQPELQILPDWERADQLCLTVADIGETIQTAIQGSVPTQLQRGDRLVDVRVQLDSQSIRTPQDLLQMPLFARSDRQVRLSDVARIENGAAPGEIQRINQRQVFIIAGNQSEGVSLGAAIAEKETIVADLDLPEGVSVLGSSSAESSRQIQAALVQLGGLATFLVFVVMAVQYNSLIDPLVIMLAVPLALAGGIVGLYVTQTAIGATVVVGAVLLVGIVVNNAIVMVERANQIYAETGDRRSAILQAAPERLRPILMTAITTVLGMFPLALGIGEGSEFLQPLGVVVFSGLGIATILTLFVIPCFYTLLHGQSPPSGSPQPVSQPVLRETSEV